MIFNAKLGLIGATQYLSALAANKIVILPSKIADNDDDIHFNSRQNKER